MNVNIIDKEKEEQVRKLLDEKIEKNSIKRLNPRKKKF